MNLIAPLPLLRTTLSLTLAVTLLGACSSDSSTNNDDDNDQNQPSGLNFDISANLVNNIVIPGYKTFAASTGALESKITAYCTDVSSTANRDAAQAEWGKVAALWQGTQSYAVGPVSPTKLNLSTRIYSPSAHTSGQDTFITNEVAKLVADSSYTIPSNANNFTRGLDALEFLLFPADTLNDTEQGNRCNYARLVAAEITTNAQGLVDAWTANNNAGRNNFLQAQDSAGVAQIKEFFELLVKNVDKSIKDTKVGIPTKLKSNDDCPTHSNACPELVENNIAKTSYASIKANLESARAIFTGSAGKGFDDIFIEAGQKTSSDAFVTNIDKAIASIDLQSGSLFDQLTAIDTEAEETACQTTATADSTDTTPAPCAIYREVKVLSDFVKTDFATVVNLDVPGPVAGDGD